MYMDGWMEALADKVHRQGEHIPQQSILFRTEHVSHYGARLAEERRRVEQL